MALATRCPNCHTTFRVVQDQLKLYSGIVRCGVCQQVFNGVDNLVNEEITVEAAPHSAAPDERKPPADFLVSSDKASDIEESEELNEELRDMLEKVRSWDSAKDNFQQQATDSTAHPLTTPAEAAPPEADQPEVEVADEFAPTELKIDEYADLDTLEIQAAREELPDITLDFDENEIEFGSVHHDIELIPHVSSESELVELDLGEPTLGPELPEWSDTVSRNEADKPREPTLELPTEPPTELPAFNQAAIDAYLSEPEADSSDAAEPTPVMLLPVPAFSAEPEFVKQAKKKQKSRRLSRALLSLSSLLLLAVLVLQGIYAFPDQIVARMPSAEPAVSRVCDFFGCETRVSASIDELSLESTELQNLPNQPNTFVLDIVLRNRSASPQAWPILELTLNDESGQPAVRRVLTPAEYLHDTSKAAAIDKGIAAESEQAFKLVFTLDKVKAAGYRVYLFYP